MTEWGGIYPRVQLRPVDGFRMLWFQMPAYEVYEARWKVKNTPVDPGPHEDFLRQLVPDGTLPRFGKDVLKKYLTRVASSSFCIGDTASTDGKTNEFMIGFRNEKDMFKILLSFPDAKQCTTWRTNANFFVRVAKDDDKPLLHEK